MFQKNFSFGKMLGPWKGRQGSIGSQLGKGPLENGMACLIMGVALFQAILPVQGLSREARGD